MALLLRQACEEVLIKHNLDAYHADINSTSKQMCLYTPCGKLFATVDGVKFGKLAPSLKEIEYATTLLDEWCTRNTVDIVSFISALEILEKMGTPNTHFKYKDTRIALNQSVTSWQHGYRRGAAECVVITTKNHMQFSYTQGLFSENKEALIRVMLDENCRKYITTDDFPVTEVKTFARKQLAIFNKYYAAKKIKDDILANLNSCKE